MIKIWAPNLPITLLISHTKAYQTHFYHLENSLSLQHMLTTFAVCLIEVHKITISGNPLEKHLHLSLKLRVNLGSKSNDPGVVDGLSLTVQHLLNQQGSVYQARPFLAFVQNP